jgi:hypothetical protein
MAKKKKKRRTPLRSLLFANRGTLRELEKEGVSRRELRAAVSVVNKAGELPRDKDGVFKDDHEFLAAIIAAELADNKSVELPGAINWDKIIELIEKLMPLIEAWIGMCAV